MSRLPNDQVDKVAGELMCAYERHRCIFVFGNGGSAALASHFACDLGKGTVLGANGQKRFRVIALTDNVALMTAWANDSSYEDVFAEQLQNLVSPGDVVFAISGSGNSANVLRALEVARSHRARILGLTGFKGGRMKALCDVCVTLPSDNMQIIEDFHVSVTHAIFSVIRYRISQTIQSPSLVATGTAD